MKTRSQTTLGSLWLTLNRNLCLRFLRGGEVIKIRSEKKVRNFALFAVLGFLAAAPVARAVTYTWTGAGFFGTTNCLWSDLNNWQGLAAPSPGEPNVTLVFPNTSAPRNTTNDIVGLTVASIQFQGANYLVTG